jgi:hypothetical protein
LLTGLIWLLNTALSWATIGNATLGEILANLCA